LFVLSFNVVPYFHLKKPVFLFNLIKERFQKVIKPYSQKSIGYRSLGVHKPSRRISYINGICVPEERIFIISDTQDNLKNSSCTSKNTFDTSAGFYNDFKIFV